MNSNDNFTSLDQYGEQQCDICDNNIKIANNNIDYYNNVNDKNNNGSGSESVVYSMYSTPKSINDNNNNIGKKKCNDTFCP